MHFTGKQRDPESTNDNFEARYFESSFGRFMTPGQPLDGQYVSEPQSWDSYVYVGNNPVNATDPDGLDCFFINEGAAWVIRGDCSNAPGGATAVTYVPGTIDETSGAYNATTGTLGFKYTPYPGGAALGQAVIGGIFPEHAVSDADRFNAVARGMQM